MSDFSVGLSVRSLQQLPEPLQARLLGPARDGQGGLVGEILDEALRNIERPARAPFKQPERWKALLRAMARALGLALQRWQPGDSGETELEQLRTWTRERYVSQQLLLLLRPQPESRWDLPLLREELRACELETERLGQKDGESWLRLLVAGFYYGVVSEPVLHELIALPALRQMAERMGVQLVMPSEGEELASQLEHLRQLVQRLFQGEDLKEELLGEIQRLLTAASSQGRVQQQAAYQAAQDVLGQVGLSAGQEPTRKETDAIARTEQELLTGIRSLQEELRRSLDSRQTGPSEPELAAMEELYRKTVRDMFERLTFKGITQGQAISLRLEEVYVELKIVAELPEAVDDSSAAERRLLQEVDRQGQLDAEQDRELDSLRYDRWRQEARREHTRIQRRGLEASGLSRPAEVSSQSS